MTDMQLIPACKFREASAFFSTSKMPDKLSKQGCCQVWEHPPASEGKMLWMSRSGSGEEGGSREQSVLWGMSSFTLCLQGWGAASPRGDTPGGQMEAKKVSFPFGSGYRMWAQTTG